MTQGFWTDARVEQLKKLWNVDGLSGSQIARTLGGGVTRNAVIGKVDRLGLAERDNNPQRGRLRKRPDGKYRKRSNKKFGERGWRYSAITQQLTRVPQPVIEMRPAKTDVSTYDFDPPADKLIALLDLEPHHCRWPIGDPRVGVLFCGQHKDGTSSYCAKHHSVASYTVSLDEKELAAIT